jgi:2-keto-4-pentenoate hydratase/2-oxohepta-3-ene-1,7-dioic acid hydratase in catechol pathway
VELGVIIGRRGKNIREEDAFQHVFGYTIVNDVSARDLQARHQQFFKGKSLDGTCPVGPWIVTADEIPDPQNLTLHCRVNGVVKQDGNSRDMIFRIPRLIAELSRGMTLEPGDVISTGTPSGVGFSRTPPEFLKPGDVVECEIEGIGTIRNTVG